MLAAERTLGVELPDEGNVRISFDDSIMTDAAAEKQQDMAEVTVGLMLSEEHRTKWHGKGGKR